MTQALLNNLNILNDNIFSIGDNSTRVDIKDFEKILDSKTHSDALESNNAANKTDIAKTEKDNVNSKNSQKSNSLQQETEVIVKDGVRKTLGDRKNMMREDTLSEEIKNLVIEKPAELIIDSVNEENDCNVAEENTEMDENTNQKANIAEESLITMHKETNATENPTTVLLLSQIQTTVKLPVTDNTETIELDSVTLQSKNEDADIPMNQKFDGLLFKDMSLISNSPKNIISSKIEQSNQSEILNEKIIKELNIESVNAEGSQNADFGDLMQNQTPQEQTVKIMIQGDIKSDVKIELVKAAEVKTVELTPGKIIEQITKQLDGMYNNSKLEMVLNPGTLGKLNLQLMNTKDGLLAQFTVTTQEAKDILMKGLNGLKETLLAQGINVDNVSVKLEENEGENTSNWAERDGSKGGNKQQGTRKQKEREKPFEQMMFEMENDDNLV